MSEKDLEKLSPEELKKKYGIIDEGNIVSPEDLEG